MFAVEKDEGLFCTEIKEIDYPLVDYSKSGLKEMIEDYISFSWGQYAHEPDENLELFAPMIKSYLLATFEESN